MGWTRQSVAGTVLRVMEEHRRAIGERVLAFREHAGLSQEELASAAGVSSKTVSRLELGRHDGRNSTIRQVAKALGVSEHDLVGRPPAPLGLDAGPSQLDRVETLLRALCEASGLPVDRLLADLEGPGDALERELGEAGPQDEAPGNGSEEGERGPSAVDR